MSPTLLTGEDVNLTLRDLMVPLVRRKRAWILTFLCVFVLGVSIGLLQRQTYESHMTILIGLEGLRSAEIHQLEPSWQLFRDGCRGGEEVLEIAARADRLLDRLRSLDGAVLLFGHGHILRVIAARFVGRDVSVGNNS